MGDDLDWEEWNPSKSSFTTHMIAGSFAGLAEHVAIFPLDTLKTQVQCEKCGSTSPMQTWNCATRIVEREGMFRLWRGVSAMFAGCIPAHAAYFSIFETMKKMTGADSDEHRPIAAAVCGATAAYSHDLIMTPFDTVKQRMQLGYYKSLTHCVSSISKKEGIRAFYLSLPTTLAMNIPFGMIMVAVNESTRKFLTSNEDNNKPISLTNSMLAGSLAGAIAAAATTPLDIIKTRLQTQNMEPCPSPVTTASSNIITKVMQNAGSVSANVAQTRGISSTASPPAVTVTNTSNTSSSLGTTTNRVRVNGAVEVAKQVLKNEGLKGFTRGMFARVLTQTPAVAVSWTAYESAKTLLTKSGF